MGLVRKWVFFFPFLSIIVYCRLSFHSLLSYNLNDNYRSDQDNYGKSLEAK